MGIHDVMGLLPHRFPFLLVDSVIDCVPGQYIHGLKNVSKNDPLLSRVDCEDQSFPHLLVIEALAQLSVILALKTLKLDPSGEELMFFAGIDDCRFESDARAGDRICMHSEVSRIRKMMGWFKASARVEHRSVVDVVMVAAIRRR
jgi:3-hydroxyacyl-[acyl-carrier-protein] dehydratase